MYECEKQSDRDQPVRDLPVADAEAPAEVVRGAECDQDPGADDPESGGECPVRPYERDGKTREAGSQRGGTEQGEQVQTDDG